MFRKLMLAGLMTATSLGGIAPAYAQRGEGGGWSRDRGSDAQRQAGQTPDRGPQGDRGRFEGRPDGQASRGNGGPANAPGWSNDRREARQDWRGDRQGDRAGWRDTDRQDRGRQDRPDWRQTQRGDGPGWRDDRRDDRRMNWNNGSRRYDDRTRWTAQRRWDNGWRQDRRYDWRSYRNSYGDRYRLGRYYAPRGWTYGYRSVSVGFILSSLLYSNSYWLDDPYSYRLPPAYGSLRWVRYYDDALLVDVRDGYVADVIRDFFW